MRVEDARSDEELVSIVEAGPRAKFVYFWGHRPRYDGQPSKACFSQWYASPFIDNAITYKTAEHYMMAEKARLFSDHVQLEKVLSANTPGEAKKHGRNVLGFDHGVWEKNRFEIVVRASVLKFSQNSDIFGFLMGTGKRVLVEASPQDRIWGVGLSRDDDRINNPRLWRGLNLLGFALMEARARLCIH